MGRIVLDDIPLDLAPVEGAWQESLLPVQEGGPGQQGAVVLETAHGGYGDSRGVLAGHYEYGQDIDATVPQTLATAPARTDLAISATEDVPQMFDLGGYTYILAGRYVRRLDPATGTITTSLDLGAGNRAKSGVAWKGKGYVATGDTIREVTPPDTWTSASIPADVLAVGLSALYRAVGAQVSKNAANPMAAGDWSAPTTFGDPSVPVTWMEEYGRFLLVGKEDGLWALNADFEAANVLPDLSAWRSADNCRHMAVWHGMLLVPHQQGLYAYAPGEVTPVGPERLELNESPVKGQVLAVAGANLWLYASLWTGSDTYILAGRERDATAGGMGPMLWHTLLRLPGVRCRALHVSGLTNPPRLYMGRGSDVSYIPLLEHAATATRASTGTIYWRRLGGRQPMTPKVWCSIDLVVEGPRQGTSVEAAVRAEDGAWRYIGEVKAPGAVHLEMPPSVIGRWLDVRLTLSGATRIRMPIVVSYVLAPHLVRAYTAVVTLGGSTTTAAQEAMFTRLQRLTAAGPVRLVTPHGHATIVQVADVRRQTVSTPTTGYVAAIAMREVN